MRRCCTGQLNPAYFKYAFGKNLYDIIISDETLHHFAREEKK
jgi:hypothetical protein